MRSVFFLVVLLSACCTPPLNRTRSETGQVVKVCDGNPRVKCFATGSGAIIGPDTVVTAYHVIDNAALNQTIGIGVTSFFDRIKYRHWHPMMLEQLILSPGNREPIAILKIKNESYVWCTDDVFKIGTGEPYKIITKRGEFLWSKYAPIRGDSGSPIINKNGYLVGVLYGGYIGTEGSGIMLRLDPKFTRN